MTGKSGTPIAERTDLDLLEPAVVDALVRVAGAAASAGAIFSCASTPTTTCLTAPAKKFAGHYGITYQSLNHGGSYGFWYEQILQIGLAVQAGPATTKISGEVIRDT